MFKKLGVILLIFALFIFGVIIGGSKQIGSNNYFEEEKDRFEEEITQPGNDYEPSPPYPQGNAFNKVARKIDEGIEGLIGGIFRRIANMMSDE